MVVNRYDKVHLVPFGEYVWFADWFPWLYQLTPLHGGSTHGAGPVCMQSEGVRYAPNICYENTLPHFIRRQVAELRAVGQEPDVLVNLTNDGWFWGSAELDLHLACSVFRAIECRKPFLVAANTGFSASIDSDGRILQQGPRRDTAVLVDQVRLDSRRSPYLTVGDWPAGLCLLVTGGFAVIGWRKSRVARPPAA
jgi:apolipoprotein N-acyltransferase